MEYLRSKFKSTLSQILLGVAVIGVLLLGWGYYRSHREQSAEGKVHLVLAINVDRYRRPIFKAAVESFRQTHPHIEVELQTPFGRYYQKMLTMMAGKMAPDLMWMGESFAEFADRGAFLDITDKVNKEVNTEDFLPHSLSWYRVNGRQYGVPYGIQMNIYAYNKKLFDEAGIPYPSDDWTFDEFLAITKKLTIDKDGDGRIDQYGFRGGLYPASFGAEFISTDGQRALCNTPEMIKFIQTDIDLAHKYKVQPSVEMQLQEGRLQPDIYTPFIQGRYAIINIFDTQRPRLIEKFSMMDWDYVLCPKVKRRAQWASSSAIVISADTRYPDEAWELCKVFFGDEFQKANAYTCLPSNLRVAAEFIAEHRGPPLNLKALLKAKDYIYVTPRVPHLSELAAIWNYEKERALMGFVTPTEAMEEAQKKMTRAIEKFNRRRY